VRIESTLLSHAQRESHATAHIEEAAVAPVSLHSFKQWSEKSAPFDLSRRYRFKGKFLIDCGGNLAFIGWWDRSRKPTGLTRPNRKQRSGFDENTRSVQAAIGMATTKAWR
jgi:hypothetical protein